MLEPHKKLLLIIHGYSMDIHGKNLIFYVFLRYFEILNFLLPCFLLPWWGVRTIFFKKVFFLRSAKRRRHAVTSQKACIFKRVFFLRSPKRRRHAVTSQKAFIDYPWIFHGYPWISMDYPWIFHGYPWKIWISHYFPMILYKTPNN